MADHPRRTVHGAECATRAEQIARSAFFIASDEPASGSRNPPRCLSDTPLMTRVRSDRARDGTEDWSAPHDDRPGHERVDLAVVVVGLRHREGEAEGRPGNYRSEVERDRTEVEVHVWMTGSWLVILTIQS